MEGMSGTDVDSDNDDVVGDGDTEQRTVDLAQEYSFACRSKPTSNIINIFPEIILFQIQNNAPNASLQLITHPHIRLNAPNCPSPPDSS